MYIGKSLRSLSSPHEKWGQKQKCCFYNFGQYNKQEIYLKRELTIQCLTPNFLTMTFQIRILVSGFCCVCHVFPPLVSIYGLFPVLVSCHYELSMFQLCLSRYVFIYPGYISPVFEFDFVWSTRYFPVYPVSESCLVLPCPALSCLVLPCPALMSIKTIIWVYVLVCVFLYPPSCVHRDRRPDPTVSGAPSPRFVLFSFLKVLFCSCVCVCPAARKSPIVIPP